MKKSKFIKEPLKPINTRKQMPRPSKLEEVNKTPSKIKRVVGRFWESPGWINFKNIFVPDVIRKVVGVIEHAVVALILLLVLNLFHVTGITWLAYVECVALYFVIEEIKGMLFK